jgi:hypothetical protein
MVRRCERGLASWAPLAVVAALAACGGAEPEPARPAPTPDTGGETTTRPASGGMQVEGLLGTIPQRKIEETMQAKLPTLQRCMFDGSGDIEFLAGHFKFYFRVGLDGRVESVHARGSSIGHRDTERCLLERAKQTRFPAPKGGGPAEFVWGFELDEMDGVRPPVAWEQARVEREVSAQRASLEACELAGAHYVVTLYVAPGGKVLGAGAAADSQAAADKIDCVLAAIRQWKMPDPGSYAAKVSFEL